MNKPLLLLLYKRQAKVAFEGHRDYADTLERLLAAETARLYTQEALSDIAARARDPSVEAADPSEELFGLRHSFPTILRGSLLPYVHGTFESMTRRVANLFLVGESIPKDCNTNVIVEQVNRSWPGTIDKGAALQLADYMHLRHACAHTAAEVGSALFDPKRVAKAADRTPGASFRSRAPDVSGARCWAGVIEFEPNFLPEAVAFHAGQLERVTHALEAPPTARSLGE